MRMEQKVSELENTLSEVWMLIGDSLDTSTQKISGRIQQMNGQTGKLGRSI